MKTPRPQSPRPGYESANIDLASPWLYLGAVLGRQADRRSGRSNNPLTILVYTAKLSLHNREISCMQTVQTVARTLSIGYLQERGISVGCTRPVKSNAGFARIVDMGDRWPVSVSRVGTAVVSGPKSL